MNLHLGLKEKLKNMDVGDIEKMYIDMMLFISRHKNIPKTDAYMQDHREITSFVHGYLAARREVLKS